MPHMRKLAWAKSPFSKPEKSRNERGDSFSNKLNVNEEYKEAFRTKSYEEMWSKIQGQLKRKSVDEIERLRSSSSSLPFCIHLSDYLFEPEQQDSSKEMLETMKFHCLLIDFFKASLEACNLCDLLLHSIQQTRVNYRRIERVIKLSKKVQDSQDYTDKACGAMFRELTAFALLRNPLSFASPLNFGDVHDNNLMLLHRLNSEQRKIRKKVKFNRICKKLGGYCLVITHTAILAAMLVMALHGIIGIVAAPGLIGCSLYFSRKKIKFFSGGVKTRLLEKLCAQLDLAAKGTYILFNDLDTISRLVRSLYNEIEHKKALADLCVRSKNAELLKEVVKEFYMHDSFYEEQLDELEEHIYLCFHTINRSRRLVIQEIMVQKNNADDS
ncbi:conserved hypothetical protein [Ricinus communis]|uniref:Uncharacterized protein n=1 Tax=Ricinus communis TaxID=3988 RepID=B9R8E2_RICCO|nr:conserved hypothetical protein [Ricinus communis]|eukprot:XP_002510585.1 UPF0496 protein At1g20180 [Ricinus communis]